MMVQYKKKRTVQEGARLDIRPGCVKPDNSSIVIGEEDFEMTMADVIMGVVVIHKDEQRRRATGPSS